MLAFSEWVLMRGRELMMVWVGGGNVFNRGLIENFSRAAALLLVRWSDSL